MSKFKRYRVASLFTHNGVVMTNDHEEEIRALPADVRDHHVKLGNLEEYESADPPTVPLAASDATPAAKAAKTTGKE